MPGSANSMMRIAFGTTVLAAGLRTGTADGIGSYTREVLGRLAERDDLSCLPVTYGETLPESFRAPPSVGITRSYARWAVFSAISGVSFPGTRRLRHGVDLVHAPDHLIPRHVGVPVVATIMDAVPLSHPHWVSMRLRWAKNMLQRRAAHWASHVVTISGYSRQQIAEHFGIPYGRISVVPLGVDERWFENVNKAQREKVLRRHDLPERFFLFVGTLQPRKNLRRVIGALEALPESVRREAPLVVVGNPGWESPDLVNGLRSGAYGPCVRWVGRVSDDDLLALMQSALGLVYPSLYEGFGLPVLEAFAAGLPVVTSNTTALPETAGDAALLVDPMDVDRIAEAMERLATDTTLAATLRRAGRERARTFTWDRTTDRTVDVYRHVLDGG